MKFQSLILLAIFTSCALNKIGDKTGVEEIQFGSGGGFTGKETTYNFNSNGELFEKDKQIKKIDAKKTLSIFKEAKKLRSYIFNEPENMYAFIVIQSKNSKNRIVWGSGSPKIERNVTELYSHLNSLLK